MDIIETMRVEHDLIRHYLQTISFSIEALERGDEIPHEFFEKAVVFARTFADRYHHYKEELLMFTRLAEVSGSEVDANLTTLRMQHERGRALVNDISQAIEGYASGDQVRRTELIVALAGYYSLLSYHIHLEDNVFFPMVPEILAPEVVAELEAEFDEDMEKRGKQTFQDCREVMREMGSLLYEKGSSWLYWPV